jgi:hypothetical protein
VGALGSLILATVPLEQQAALVDERAVVDDISLVEKPVAKSSKTRLPLSVSFSGA